MTSGATTSPTPTTAEVMSEPTPEPWQPIAPGPFEVGVATITLPDPERPLTVDVWFPLDAGVDVATLALEQYTLLPGVYYESPTAFAATAEQMAADPFGSGFPLVVYSHGSGGLRYIHSAYTEAIASNGYIVVAADHTGNTAVDRLAGNVDDPEQVTHQRPLDVGRLIDAFTDPTDPVVGAWAAGVDADHVAVTGHSLGGYTSIAMVTGIDDQFGSIAPDPRVDAIVLLAPAVLPRLLAPERLATISVPMMVLVGSDDITTPVDPNLTTLWESTVGTPAYRIVLNAAEHQSFTDVCEYQAAIPTLANVPDIVTETIDTYAVEGCSPGDMPDERVNQITITYAVEFLDQIFKGAEPIDFTQVAAPDDVIVASR